MNLEENKENQQKMYVAIKTVDNLIYHVEWEWAQQSPTIWNMLDDLNITKGLTWEEIRSPDFIYDTGNTLHFTNEVMTGPFFKKAMMWIENNMTEPDFQSDTNKDLSKEKDEWETSYFADMTIDGVDINRLLIVAKFLEIKGLVNLITTIYVPKMYLIIKTVDKEIFYVEWETAWQSKTIRNMLDDLNITKGPTLEEILDPGFIYDTGNTLCFTNEEMTRPFFRKAMMWIEKIIDEPDFHPDYDKNLSKEQDEWETSYFADMIEDDMRRLMIVAKFLEIKGLITLITTFYVPKMYLIIKTVDKEIFLVEWESAK